MNSNFFYSFHFTNINVSLQMEIENLKLNISKAISNGTITTIAQTSTNQDGKVLNQ